MGKAEFSLQDELDNWNPVFSFRQIDDTRKRVLPIPDRNPADDIEAVRVLLDSDKLKSWLAHQMKKQTAATAQVQSSTYMPKLKLALKLSDRDWRKHTSGAQIQAAPTRGDVDELIDLMQLEAEYT
ncbi:hypothetical protein MXD63_40490, partial [Frankia sp. Cpl3]|nr:hypothetical protein [Frankia sp. Cpl3]